MRKVYILALLTVVQIIAKSQSITPLETAEFCPNTEIVFSVSVPGSNPNVYSYLGGCLVTQGPYNLGSSGNNTTFNFKGRFNDVNQRQIFRVDYNGISSIITKDFVFKNIKSLNIYTPSGNCPGIYIKSDVTALTGTDVPQDIRAN